MAKEKDFKEKELTFNKFIVAEYLKHGSVDELFKANHYDIPISYPQVQRLLEKWGIVKAAGPNTRLTECIGFMVRLVEEQIPLETLYKKMPPSFSPSMGTLHRIYRDIKKEVKKAIEERNFRRAGAALVISKENEENSILIGRDISPPRLDLGKPFGAISLPMGFSKKSEEEETSILRVLQQEVFTKEAINKNFPKRVIPKEPTPFMFVDIADVRVSVYHLELPSNFSENSFSSFRLKNHRFIESRKIAEEALVNSFYRTGVVEIANGYMNYLSEESQEPIYATSFLNSKLISLALGEKKELPALA